MPAAHDVGTSPRQDLVVIGASAGGVEALAAIAEDLSADFGAAVSGVECRVPIQG